MTKRLYDDVIVTDSVMTTSEGRPTGVIVLTLLDDTSGKVETVEIDTTNKDVSPKYEELREMMTSNPDLRGVHLRRHIKEGFLTTPRWWPSKIRVKVRGKTSRIATTDNEGDEPSMMADGV